jgi:hypothetical protein
MVACIDFFEMSEICRPKFIVRHSTTYFFILQLLYLRFCWKIIRGANIRGFLLLHVKCLCTKIHSTPGMWLQKNGAPRHFHRNVRQYLGDNFTNICIGRSSNNLWPLRSPDLTPLNFFLVGPIKRKSLQLASKKNGK